MINVEKIKTVAEEKLKGSDSLFVVDVKESVGGVFEVLIDSDGSVSIDDCVALSRAIEGEFDRDEEDFELTVASYGIGQPLKMLRQYRKLVGKSVEVLLKSGVKLVAELTDATEDSITIKYMDKIVVEGKKRKETVEVCATHKLEEIKSTKEFLDFK